jgi:hypothetical protein
VLICFRFGHWLVPFVGWFAVEVVEDVVAGHFGLEMHQGRLEGNREGMPVDATPVECIGEKIDEIGVAVVVGVGG